MSSISNRSQASPQIPVRVGHRWIRAPRLAASIASVFLALAAMTLVGGCGGSSFLNPVLKIKGIDPALGPSTGGPTIRIVGAGFVEGSTEVAFGETVVPAGDLEFISQVELRVFLPPLMDGSAIGPTDITVRNPASAEEMGGSDEEVAVLRGAFAYFADQVDFDSYRNVTTPADPRFAATSDLDRNGTQDLVIAHRGTTTAGISRFTSLGNGGFTELDPFIGLRGIIAEPTTTSTIELQPNRFVLAPFRGLNFDDLIVTAQPRRERGDPAIYELLRFDSDGSGQLRLADSFRASDIPTLRSFGGDTILDGAGAVTSGDFDADGTLDVAIVYLHSEVIAVLFGDGNGGFFRLVTLPTGSRPVDIESADLNGDGRLDLATANFGDGTVSVYFGIGSGRFDPAPEAPMPNGSFPAGTFPISIGTGNFSASDSIRDLVVANNRADGISLLEGDGFNGFLEPRQFRTGTAPSSLVVTDLDGDGSDDLAVANSGNSTITILLQLDPGSFTEETLVTGRRPETILAFRAVLNEVALPDLVSINAGANSFSLHENLGDAFFDQPEILGGSALEGSVENGVSFDVPAAGIAADFTSDGIDDLLIADNGNEHFVVVAGTANGQFRQDAPILTCIEGLDVAILESGDFDGDGNLDVAWTTDEGATLDVLLGNGTGSFNQPTIRLTTELPFASFGPLAAADVNGDDRDDLLVGTADGSRLLVYELTLQSGVLALRRTASQSLSGSPLEIVTGDWNDDLHVDVAVAGTSSSGDVIDIFIGARGGVLTPGATLASENAITNLRAGDVDGDGILDLVSLTDANAPLDFFLGDGLGSFLLADIEFETPRPITSIECEDLNGDRIADIIGLDSGGNQLLAWKSQGAAGKFDDPVMRGIAENPLAILPFFANGIAVPDLAVLHRRPAVVTVIRNTSF